MACDVNNVGGVVNETDVNLGVECESVTGVFGDVCWLTCKNKLTLKNDELAGDVLSELLRALNEATITHNITM